MSEIKIIFSIVALGALFVSYLYVKKNKPELKYEEVFKSSLFKKVYVVFSLLLAVILFLVLSLLGS